MASGFFEACASNALATVFVDYLVKPTVRHIGYLFRFDKIVKDLREHSNQLSSKQESVEKDVKEAKNQIQEVKKEVKDWQKDALKVQQNIESLEVKIQENKRWCFTWCPNLSWRYRLSKQAAEKDLAISELMNKSFPQVGHPADLPGLRFLASKDFLPYASADLAERQIMEALKDDGVNIIGVWGMGGIGKTTLVNEVGRKVKESKLFGEVVNAVVSQNQNIEKIQDKIAELLKSKLENKSEAGKAEQLWVRLQNEKSILIILDDLWKELDLKAVGIPIGEHHKGCKILLTTRSQKVCSDMSGRVIKLDGLKKEEALQLFKMSAELNDDTTTRDILKVADEVAKECKGLPIALSTLGKALKNETIRGWRDACRKLKSSRLLDIPWVEDDKNAYMCLKFSYDFLKNKETKICFLLCSIYPEDFSIPVEELVRHVWGLKIFQGSKSIQEARDAVYAQLGYLKASCLLLDDGQNFIKMHDMVRDVALWIASQKENHVVIKSEVGASVWPGNENFEAYTTISFMECKIKEIPMGLEYPKLELLSFTAKDTEETVTISGASFEGMKSLKVLNLSLKGSLSNDALHFLTNLRTLYLEYCKLNTYSISSLGELKKLEILSFYGSDIEVLPDEVGDLKSLRLLDLSNCRSLQRIPPNVIQRLSQLEELYFCGCGFDEWLIEGTDAEVKNASLLELNKLPKLVILVVSVGDVESLPKNFVFPKLQNYSIAIEIDGGETYPSKRCLKVNRVASFKAFKNLCEDVELLKLGDIANCQNIVPSLDQGGFKSLSILRTRSCKDMECLIDARNQHVPVALSNLSVLEIKDMNCFERLSNGLPPNGFLTKLESLEIKRCHKVKSLFPSSVTQSLLQLKSLKITDCKMLEQIFEEIEGANQLNSLRIRKCPKLEYIFPSSSCENLNLPQLKKLVLTHLDQPKEVVAPRQGRDGNDVFLKLPSLRSLWLDDCPNLRPFGASFSSQLEEISIESVGMKSNNAVVGQWKQNSPNMEYAVIGNNAEEMFQLQHGNILSHLRYFQLTDLPELRVIWRSPNQLVTLQNLQQMYLYDCKRLRYVFSPMLAPNLPKLLWLTIEGCEELEEIVDTSSSSSSTSQDRDLQPFISFPNLTHIFIKGCNSLKYVFPTSILPHLQQLQMISILEASKLEQVFGFEDNADAKDHHHHHQEEVKRVELPRLNDLSLEELPSLISFSSVDYNILFPSLTKLKVTNCPHLTTTFTINDSQRCERCARDQPQMQASQQTEDSVDAQVTTWPRGSNIKWRKPEGGGR